jgi:peptidoglycan/xylan/chitin deacetylase (PgdA/CDA1 family)
MSPELLRLCFDVLHGSGATRMFAPYLRGRGIIFCLHQVVPGGGNSDGFKPNSQLEVSTEFLDAALSYIKAQGYRLISLSDALAELHIERQDAPPFAVMTLDDGYRDNAEHAAPIFRKHNCPYTIFVSSGIADGTCELWWKALEEVLATNNRVRLPNTESPSEQRVGTDTEKQELWSRLATKMTDMNEIEQRIWIRNLSNTNGVDVEAQCKSLAMHWDELRVIAADPLCTIGAHTVKHFCLSKLPKREMMRQMSESAARIEQELGKPPRFIAYPYGDLDHAGPREFTAASELGFQAAVTTRKGVIFSQHRNHRFALPRVMMSGRYQQLKYLDALMSGVPLALLNKFRKVNVTAGPDRVSTST